MKTKSLIAIFVIMFVMSFGSSEQFLIYSETQDSNIRVEDSTFFRQNLQTGETISNPSVVIIIESLGVGLIFLFIIIYAIKKRRRKQE